ncbi:MAG TPA: hypothetical protein VHH73_17405, partial [Verrucomicrobiae bacterium]|nr:hypothetical protein [Verrucomicrobiae bacterium]
MRILTTLLIVCLAGLPRLARAEYFTIRVVDGQTGRGVPLVELRAVDNTSWWTDSNGLIALDEPGLWGQEVFFHVQSHGYEYPKDFFGNHGLKIKLAPGGNHEIKLKRLNLAERLYRETGQGIYRDSVLLGQKTPLTNPLLNAQVVGQDTVIVTPYRGKLYWFWGDTDRVGYPLGNFNASGAWSDLPEKGGLNPAVGVDLHYFSNADGFSKGMCPLPGQGLRWIEGLVTVLDETGRERLVARVANVRGMEGTIDWRLMVFNDEKEVFEPVQRWDSKETHDSSHPFRARVDGVEYYYLYPNYRVRADLASLKDLGQYAAYTCVAGDGKIRGAETQIDRDANGHPRYVWKPGADRLYPGRIDELARLKKLETAESWIHLHDVETGRAFTAGRGSVFWNEFRQRWVMLVSGNAGEIWFTEGDTPTGPWVYARRVVTHNDYNFYNPTQHPFFDEDGGRLIYFEGTYTASFSGARQKTPRYDYNQMMYRLALDNDRLALPAPVYRVQGADGREKLMTRVEVVASHAWTNIIEIAFFALPAARPQPGWRPAIAREEKEGFVLHVAGKNEAARPLFYLLPEEQKHSVTNLDGPWHGVAKVANGPEAPLDFRIQGSTVIMKPDTRGASSSFREGKLQFQMTMAGKNFELSGELTGEELTGKWRQIDGDLTGTWSATPDTSDQLFGPGALSPLHEYRRESDGRRLYSTREIAPAGYRLQGGPLGRVWKNPL